MTTSRLRFTSPPDSVDSVHDLLARVWSEASVVGPMDRVKFETAVIELAANVIRHADDGSGVTCELTVKVTPSAMTARLVDTGQPGEVDLERGMPDPLAESGRGIPLVRALVDRLEYSRADGHNQWEIERVLMSQ